MSKCKSYPATLLKACHVKFAVFVLGWTQTQAGIVLGLNTGTVSKILSTSGFLIVPEVVSRSDMIALIPRRIADGWSDRVQVLDPPLPILGFTIASVWHDRATNHPAQLWLRERLRTLAAEG